MDIAADIFLPVFSYLLGSVPTGLLIARYFFKVDIRSTGSGNIGATNVARTLGKQMGIMTLAGDALKGAIPVTIAMLVRPVPINQQLVFFCALAAFLGHLFPVYLKFRGGKGVATALGIFIVLFPLQALLAAVVFSLIVFKTRYVSLGSMIAAALMPVFVCFRTMNLYNLTLSIIISLLVIYKHKENIHRLLEGRESKFGRQQ